MKILVFTTLYPNNVWPNQGVFIKERMTQFARLEGCEVKVVAPVPYCPAIKTNWRGRFSQVTHFEVRDGLDVYHPRYFMTPKLGMIFYGAWMFLSVLPTLRRVHKDFQFDLIDAHFVYPDGFAAVLLGKYFQKTVAVSARGSDINLYSTFPMIRRILNYTLARARVVIAVSEALKEVISTLGVSPARVYTVPNGVDIDKFYPTSQEAARKKLNLPKKRIILSAGNLTANKGFSLLVRAFSRLSSSPSGEDAFLVIIGEGPLRRELETLITSLAMEDRVKLVGTVPHDQMRLWYNAADVFCLMSEREGLPNVLLEALACGVPVVATSVGGIPEIVSSVDVGLLTAREEPKIAGAISEALSRTWDPVLVRQGIGRFSWARSACMIRKIFEQALQSNSSTRNAVPDGEDVVTCELLPDHVRAGSISRRGSSGLE